MDERAINVQMFQEAAGPCLFLSTLRCGGVGLNLTMASKVINIDPWWNWAIEQQAFGRVFRIGQDQKTTLARMFAKNTVDERILKLQQKKQENIDAVMDPDVTFKKTKMTIKELLGLFGNVSQDDKGRYFLVPEENVNQCPIFDDDAYHIWDEEAEGLRRPRFA